MIAIGGIVMWQPIETAPKDGTKILACCESDYNPVTVSWREYHPNAKGKATWRTADGSKCEGLTHWMLRPEPPETLKMLEVGK